MSKKTGIPASPKAMPGQAKAGGAAAILERLRAPEMRMVALKDIRPNKWNGPREADAEMVQSIRARGILQSLIGRTVPGHKGAVEIVGGSRRLDGAKKAQLTEVPCLVYEMTDQQARECNAIENLQREDKTPLEEARDIAGLLKDGKTAKEIGAIIGRPWTFVVRRAKLDDLALPVKQALDNPKSCISKNCTVGALEMLALFPHEVQQAYYREHANQDWGWDEHHLRTILGNAMHKLALALWAVDDALLVPKAGACLVCPKRSGAAPGLFDDVDDPAGLKANDQCLDGQCWAAKLSAFRERAEAEARKEHPDLVKVAVKHIPTYSSDARCNELLKDKSVIGAGAFEKVKAGDKDALPALVVYGPGEGKVIYIRKQRSAVSSQRSDGEERKPKTMAEKRAGLDSRRVALIIVQKLKPELAASKGPKPGGDPLEAIKDSWWLRLVAAFGAQELSDGSTECILDGWDGWDKSKKQDADELHAEIWILLKQALIKSVEFYRPTDLEEDCIANAKRLAWLLGLKWPELEKWAAEQIPEPKSWEKEK